jgi:hypothetical protein
MNVEIVRHCPIGEELKGVIDTDDSNRTCVLRCTHCPELSIYTEQEGTQLVPLDPVKTARVGTADGVCGITGNRFSTTR